MEIDHALVTGGAGFIGSNIVHDLVADDIQVTVLDNMSSSFGANESNLSGVQDEIELRRDDITNAEAVKSAVSDVDVVYHLAAQLSRPLSIEKPHRDVEINCNGTLNILEAIKQRNKNIPLIYAGTQAAFGVPNSLPVTEDHPDNPIDIYGANKLAGEHYCRVYSRIHDIPTLTLRLTNVYGPRAQLDNPKYGVINNFLRLAFEGDTLEVFDPGTMKRDPIYVADVVDAFRLATQAASTEGPVFVIGGGNPVSINTIAQQIVDTVGSGEVEIVEWPDDWDSVRVGDIYVDPSRAHEKLGWTPETDLSLGLQQTVDYYKTRLSSYL